MPDLYAVARAVDAATDALEVYFNVQEPVTVVPRGDLAVMARKVIEAALPHLEPSDGCPYCGALHRHCQHGTHAGYRSVLSDGGQDA